MYYCKNMAMAVWSNKLILLERGCWTLAKTFSGADVVFLSTSFDWLGMRKTSFEGEISTFFETT